MGFTRYWDRPKKLPVRKYKKFVEEAEKLKNVFCSVTGVKICGGNGTGEPEYTPKTLCFNGTEENDEYHETFTFDLEEDMSFGSPFCKTARKPYDSLVVMTLMLAKEHFPNIKFENNDPSEGKDVIEKYDYFMSIVRRGEKIERIIGEV